MSDATAFIAIGHCPCSCHTDELVQSLMDSCASCIGADCRHRRSLAAEGFL